MADEKIATISSVIAFLAIALIIAFGVLHLNISSEFSFGNAFETPSLCHLFGTDNYGRDMVLLTLAGLSISLITSLLSSLISILLAIIVALFVSSENRLLSNAFETLANAVLGIPHIVLMILISFACGKGTFGVIMAVSLTHWPTLSRILSNELKQIKTSNWYKTETSLCKNKLQLVTKHIVPNLSNQLFTGLFLALPHAILHESTLTFLGFGFSPEIPAIGNILSDTMKFALTGNWWLAFFPGASLIVTTIVVSKLTGRLKYRLENTI